MSAPLLFQARAQLYRAAFPSTEYLTYIRSNGLGLKSLRDPDPFDDCGALVVTTIAANPAGGFDFVAADDPNAVVAAVIEAYGADRHSTADLVGWPVADPTRFRCVFNRTDCLGAWNITNAADTVMSSPLRVWRTPLAWLQAGCRGVVLLDPPQAARRLLDAPGTISGEDRAHSKELANLVSALVDRRRFVAPVSSVSRKAA